MPRKKTKTRSVYVTKEPDWKALRLVEGVEEQRQAFRSCEYFVRTEIKSSKTTSIVKEWIKNKSGWSKEEVKLILANPDWAFSAAGTACYVEYKLGYMPAEIIQHYEKRKEEWIKRGKELIKEKKEAQAEKPKRVITIKERMADQLLELFGEWENKIDQLTTGELDVKKFDPYKEMKAYHHDIKANHAKLIVESYEANKAEAKEVLEWTDPDIKEGYSFMTPKMRKDFVAFFDKIDTACETILNEAKSNRKARKPRARSKESIVKKLKFLESFSELGIASVHPTDVVHCNELWVYNTKNRKLGVYHARNKDPRNMGRDGLMVKGTTIKDFDEELSTQKTLRKPADMINNWTGSAKTKFAKAYDDLTTTPIKMNGRINEHTILLKTF